MNTGSGPGTGSAKAKSYGSLGFQFRLDPHHCREVPVLHTVPVSYPSTDLVVFTSSVTVTPVRDTSSLVIWVES
jgi:hypothetical protein